MFKNPDRDQIKKLLLETETIAVVGLSDNPTRTSYMISKAMQDEGFRIIPVNPTVTRVLGEPCYPSLLEIPNPSIDIVNVFRRSEYIYPIAEQAVRIGAKALWLQQGIINEQAANYAKKHGLVVIMDRCIKVEAAILLHL